ncbi:MAG: hypothetical protein LBO78_00315 [Rickettsiales bacterium]|jgi:hypothetical protein|nr:hypothetical protein [Rickettsiales bacterium]
MKRKLEGMVNLGAFASVLFHFVVCGLPMIFVILGGLGIALESPLYGYFSHKTMTAVLVVSGLLLAASAFLHARRCRCGAAAGKYAGIGLAAAGVLYAIALAGHFAMPFIETNAGTMCH